MRQSQYQERTVTTMEIDNLEINVLYCLCDGTNERGRRDMHRIAAILEEFSDIPQSNIFAVIDGMRDRGWIRLDRSGSALDITKSGIRRLQASIACRIHRFDHCRWRPASPPSLPA